jgi:hypothetical protein
MMEKEVLSRWSLAVDTLLKAHLATDREIADATAFKTALIKALSDAYEKGLQDGLVTKATGPDA